MSAPPAAATALINAFLTDSGEELAGAQGARPGKPYAREAPLTAYGLTVAVSIDLDVDTRVDCLISSPVEVFAALAGLEPADEAAMASALGARVEAIVSRALASARVQWLKVGTPLVVWGPDVTLRWLSGRRVCMAWQTAVGSFVVEAGIHVE